MDDGTSQKSRTVDEIRARAVIDHTRAEGIGRRAGNHVRAWNPFASVLAMEIGRAFPLPVVRARLACIDLLLSRS